MLKRGYRLFNLLTNIANFYRQCVRCQLYTTSVDNISQRTLNLHPEPDSSSTTERTHKTGGIPPHALDFAPCLARLTAAMHNVHELVLWDLGLMREVCDLPGKADMPGTSTSTSSNDHKKKQSFLKLAGTAKCNRHWIQQAPTVTMTPHVVEGSEG